MKIIEKEFNVLTGEEIIIERDATPEEINSRQIIEAEIAQHQLEVEAKAAQRQAILNKLGLTAEEAQILLGGN